MKKYLILALLIIGGLLYFTFSALSRQKAETSRYRNNYESASEGLRSFKVRDSLNAVEKKTLELTAREFRQKYDVTAQLLKDAGLKLKHLRQVATVETETVGGGIVTIRDTIIVRDSIMYAKRFEYSDNFAYICGEIQGDKVKLDYTVRESLIMAISPQYKRFLWIFRYRTRHNNITVISTNPKTIITDVELITLK